MAVNAELWELRLAELLKELNRAGPERLMPVLLERLNEAVGAKGVRLFFADMEERVLSVWGERGGDEDVRGNWVLIEGSAHGEVYRTGRVGWTEVKGDPAVLAPVVARSERLGVLEVRIPKPGDAVAEQVAEALGLLLGYLVICGDRWTDEFTVARRRERMKLAAEMQWNLLPMAALSTDRIAVAGALEPAYEIGGDGFDYSCGPRTLTAAIFDSMGHGLDAARVGSLAVSAFRNARRAGHDLQTQARFVHEAIAESTRGRAFVTGQFLSVDLANPGTSAIVNAGHPAPLLQHGDGGVEEIAVEVDFPLGMPFLNLLTAQPLPLRPGDRLTLFSDGIVEARPDGGTSFGGERLAAMLERVRGLSPRESARTVIKAVREHRQGELTDDATLLIVDVPASAAEVPGREVRAPGS